MRLATSGLVLWVVVGSGACTTANPGFLLGSSAAVTTTTCGDGVGQDSETCDDGGPSPLPSPICGDGLLAEEEQCDDMNLINQDACSEQCLFAYCGDNYVFDGTEECDDGNFENSDACLENCTRSYCGDGHVHLNVEECDDGNGADGDGCSHACLFEILPTCGNGTLEVGEECDDMNLKAGDGCNPACRWEIDPDCGNGVLDADEACDPTAVPYAADVPICLDDCSFDACLFVENTPQIDLADNEWLSKCAFAEGDTVHVAVLNGNKLLYYARGSKPNVWDPPDRLTSDGPRVQQFILKSHQPILLSSPLDVSLSGELYLYGRASESPQAGCEENVGDGYGLAIHSVGNLTPKLLLMSYSGGQSNQPRIFHTWTPEAELSFTEAESLALCMAPGPAPLVATIIVAVTGP